MKKIKPLPVILAAILLALSACNDKPTEPPIPKPNVTGTWQGKGTKSGIPYTVTATLAQAEGDTAVSGNGDIAALFAKVSFSVTGANAYPDVRLTFTSSDPSFGTGSYAGKFAADNDNRIDGAATVPAFGIRDEALAMERIK